ncbi:hypothetical protein V8E51_007291 [Hyaloscypha variabilis]
MDNPSLLQDPTDIFNYVPSSTKPLLSPIRTATASTLAHVAANSTAAKAMHLIKVFQKIIFDSENTIALLTASNSSANTRISSLTSENEELKAKVERIATQMKVLTQALQLQLEPKMVKSEMMRRNGGRGTRRPCSFGGLASARFAGLCVDVGSVKPRLARVVESPARVELSFAEPSTCTFDTQPALAVTTVVPVGKPLEDSICIAVAVSEKTKKAAKAKKTIVLHSKKLASKREKRELVKNVFREYWW